MGTGKADGFQTVSTLGRASKKKGAPSSRGIFGLFGWLIGSWYWSSYILSPAQGQAMTCVTLKAALCLGQKSRKLHSILGEGNGTPLQFLPGKSHGRRSLVGCSPWGREESDTTERLHFHFLLSRIGEGNGNPLQYSCLDNPRDRGAWWAAVYGVAQSRTRLKWLSSSIPFYPFPSPVFKPWKSCFVVCFAGS